MIASVRGIRSRSIASGGALAVAIPLQHEPPHPGLFDHVGDVVPPGEPGRVEERGRYEKRRRHVAPRRIGTATSKLSR